jgi:hypothetical protein
MEKFTTPFLNFIYEEFSNSVDWVTALRFMPLAARRIRIFPDESACLMAGNVWNEVM